METNNQEAKIQHEEALLQDTYNDDYWQVKYGVSKDELKSTHNIGISAKILEVNSRKRAYQL